MTSLRIWTAQCSAAGLANEVHRVHEGTGLDFLAVEWWNGPGTFTTCDGGWVELAKRAADSTGGTAFGRECELQWRLVGDEYWLVLVAEREMPALEEPRPGLAIWRAEHAAAEQCCRSRTAECFLWGSQWLPQQGFWIEERIPRPLNYPVEPEAGQLDAVRLQVVEYLDRRGEVIAKRRTGLKAWFKSKEDNRGAAIS